MLVGAEMEISLLGKVMAQGDNFLKVEHMACYHSLKIYVRKEISCLGLQQR